MKACSQRRLLYLPLDVDLLRRPLLGVLEETHSFTGKESYFAVLTLLEEGLTVVMTDEPGTLVVRLEAKFFCDEA